MTRRPVQRRVAQIRNRRPHAAVPIIPPAMSRHPSGNPSESLPYAGPYSPAAGPFCPRLKPLPTHQIPLSYSAHSSAQRTILSIWLPARVSYKVLSNYRGARKQVQGHEARKALFTECARPRARPRAQQATHSVKAEMIQRAQCSDVAATEDGRTPRPRNRDLDSSQDVVRIFA